MCTALTLHTQTDEQFFGRTMDFSHDINPQLLIIPRDYTWNSMIDEKTIKNNYNFIGLGQELDGLLGFFDGVNEKGLAAAVLYFAGYAEYGISYYNHYKESIASIDLLHYILGNCSCVDDLPTFLQNVNIVGIPDPITNSIAPLHWIATDRSGACVVIESTSGGLVLTNNPLGVMANSPDFGWHMTNLRNYMEASPTQTEEASWDNIYLKPFGQAGGTIPLPGGFTSPERFVRTAYLKTHLPMPKDSTEAINACFHVMESVSIPKGAVITSRNTYDYTKYTAFINVNTCEYFYKTYDDLQIRTASLWEE